MQYFIRDSREGLAGEALRNGALLDGALLDGALLAEALSDETMCAVEQTGDPLCCIYITVHK